MGVECYREGLRYRFLVQASSQQHTDSISFASRQGKTAGSSRAGEHFAGKEGDRASVGSYKSRLLQPPVCGTKACQEYLESYSGSQCVGTPVCNTRGIQDGNSRRRPKDDSAGGVGSVIGFLGCLLPCNDASQLQEVPEICLGRAGVPVSSSTNGPVIICSGLHQDHQGDKSLGSEVRDTVTPVYRRLADTLSQSQIHSSVYSAREDDSREIGIPHQREKIRIDPHAAIQLPGFVLQSGGRQGIHNNGALAEAAGSDQGISDQYMGHSQSVAVSHRQDGFNREGGSPRHVAHQAIPGCIEPAVVTADREPERQAVSTTRADSTVGLVEEPRACVSGGVIPVESSQYTSLRGCKFLWLGGTRRYDEGSGKVERQGERPTHQCPGAAGCSEGAQEFQCGVIRQNCDDSIGQCNNSELYSEARRHKILHAAPPDTGAVQVGGSTGNTSSLSAHCRQIECAGRFSVSAGADTAHRMVPSSADSGRFMDTVGSSNARPLRNVTEQQVGSVCVADPGRESTGGRRHVSPVDRLVCLRLPSHSDTGSCAQEDAGGKVHHSVDSPMVASASLVPCDIGAPGGLASRAPSQVVPPQAASFRCISSGSSDDEATCLEVIQRAHRKRGFSAPAAERIAQRQKSSSTDVYEAKWRNFRTWCSERNVNPRKASVYQVADFLCHLHEDKGLKLSTIEGYRTAISHVCKATQGVDYGKDPHLSGLIANFARDVTKRKSVTPSWNLSLVLQVLTNAPFEPLHLGPLKYLTYKTVFLLTFATGSRRSEVHAFRADTVQRQENGGAMLLYSDLQFVAKTQLANQGNAVLQPVVVKALSRILGPDMDKDRVLCPVRALRFYLDRTKDLRSGRNRLFISFKSGYTKDICKNTISSWLKKTIVTAYKLADKDTCQLVGVKAHDVRAMASSWALQRNVSMDNILTACQWKNHSTFTQFYLKDLTVIQEDMLRLGPLVAAQQLL